MSRTKSLLMLLFLIAGIAAGAQNNVIKAGFTGAVIGDFNIGIEKKVTPKSSLHLKAGFLEPTSSPVVPVENLIPEPYRMLEVNGGLTTSLEFRFYLSRKEGLRGFYLAPYARHFSQSMLFEDVIDEYAFKVDGQLNTYGAGLQLGYQWIIKEVFSIDLFFLGSGIDFHNAEITYSMDPEPEGFDYSMVTPYVDDVFRDINFLYKNLEHEVRDDSHYSKIPVSLPGFRAGISLGVAF